MVRVPIRDIDVKKLKMAKEVFALLEILGIGEEDLDNLVAIRTFREEIGNIKAEINSLKEFKEKMIKSEKTEATGGRTNSFSDGIKNAFVKGAEEYHLNGKR